MELIFPSHVKPSRWMSPGVTPSLWPTVSSLTPAWMHWNGATMPAYTHRLIRSSGPWPTWVNKGLAKQWPQIILQHAPLYPLPQPSSTLTQRAPTPHAETKTGDSSQTDSSEAIWRDATQSLGLPLRSARHTPHLDGRIQLYACSQVPR